MSCYLIAKILVFKGGSKSLRHGLVLMQLNGQTYPAVLTPGTGGVSTFTAAVPAPLIASLSTGSPYPVVVNYAPDTPGFAAPVPPFSFNLPVGLAASSITQTVTPATPAANAPVTVAGTITAPAGITPTGTVTVTVSPFVHLCLKQCCPLIGRLLLSARLLTCKHIPSG